MLGVKISDPLKIAVVGYRNSGKTYAGELIIKTAKDYPLKVLAVKHVHDESFSIDREGSDSWRMRFAGADASMVVSPKELSIIYPGDRVLDRRSLLPQRLINDYDVVVMEGFKDKALGDPGIAKVLCIRSREDLEVFNSKLKGDLVALCSLADLGDSTLILGRDDDELRRRITRYLEYYVKVKEIMGEMPGLDCGKCSFHSCLEMAKAIYRGEKRIEDCPVISYPIDVEVEIGGSKIPMQPFVARMIRSTILAMISNLKGVEVSGNEKLKIKIF